VAATNLKRTRPPISIVKKRGHYSTNGPFFWRVDQLILTYALLKRKNISPITYDATLQEHILGILRSNYFSKKEQLLFFDFGTIDYLKKTNEVRKFI